MKCARLWKWLGFLSSLPCVVQSGIFLSFNVYAVQLKETFDFTQTQVELISSFSISGLALILLGYVLIERCGYVISYVVSWFLVTLSGILLWVATNHPVFFKENIAFICAFEMALSAGSALAELCCISVGVMQFDEKHVGKVTGIYLALVSLGKIYYILILDGLSQLEPNLGLFFLSIPVGMTGPLILCLIFHRPKTDATPEGQELLKNGEDGEANTTPDGASYGSLKLDNAKDTNITIKGILSSKFFHIFFWSNSVFISYTFALMNNITSIAQSIGMANLQYVIYLVSLGTMAARIVFGTAFDYFHSKLASILLFMICYVTFLASMAIGYFWLDANTIYILTTLASVGMGACFSLTIGTLAAVFGREKYSFLVGLLEIVLICFTLVVSLIIGMIYDHHYQSLNPKPLFCSECYRITYLLVMCGCVISIITCPIIFFVWKERPVNDK